MICLACNAKRDIVSVRYRYFADEEDRPSILPCSQQSHILNPKVPLFTRSYSPANKRVIIYVVDPIKRTTKKKRGAKHQGGQHFARREGVDAPARRNTEYRMK